jgi:hypothetical protein
VTGESVLTEPADTHAGRDVAAAAAGSRLLTLSRGRAFAAHLALSASVVGVACAAIFFVWYPAPYFEAAGAAGVLRVLIGVDLVVGPLLTLIVYKPGKRHLKLDLAVIAAIQAAALIYGLSVIYRERPYYTVFAVDRFFVLARGDVVPEQRDDPSLVGSERIGERPSRGPLLVVANRPSDVRGRQRLLEETVFQGQPDIERRPEFWARYTDETAQVLRAARPLAQLAAARPDSAREIAAAAARHGRSLDDASFLPLTAKNRDLALLLDRVSGAPLGVIDVDPWVSGADPDQ